MMILDKIVQHTRARVEIAKTKVPLEMLKTRAPKDFAGALRGARDLAVIAEIKKASPSKGVIDAEFNYLQIAREYEEAGATAISVLTESEFFMGANEYLTEISQAVTLPILRKDFTVDKYQIYEALSIGADAILLIAAVLDTESIREFLKIAGSLGLAAIVEAHNEREIESALEAGAEIIGVNNRNLQTFEVDLTTSARLRSLVPREKFFISESGIETVNDIRVLRATGVNGVLIGESFMRAEHKCSKMKELLG